MKIKASKIRVGDIFEGEPVSRSCRVGDAMNAQRDQAVAAAREILAPLRGEIVDTNEALLTCIVDRDGIASCTTRAVLASGEKDWQWVADALISLAEKARAKIGTGQ